MNEYFRKYAEKQAREWTKNMNAASEMISPDILHILDDRMIREYKYEEKLTEKMKKVLPETLFVICFTVTKDEGNVSKCYILYYKKDKFYGLNIMTEYEGSVIQDMSATLTHYQENWEYMKEIEEDNVLFYAHRRMLEMFKEVIFDLNEYRLYAATGMIE